MVFDLPPTYYIAQVYNCDAYGAAAYNECLVTSDTSSGAATTDTPATTDSPQTTKPSTQNGSGTEAPDIPFFLPAKTVASMDWWIIILIALIVTALIAWIILLIKRRKRREPPQQQPPIYY